MNYDPKIIKKTLSNRLLNIVVHTAVKSAQKWRFNKVSAQLALASLCVRCGGESGSIYEEKGRGMCGNMTMDKNKVKEKERCGFGIKIYSQTKRS